VVTGPLARFCLLRGFGLRRCNRRGILISVCHI